MSQNMPDWQFVFLMGSIVFHAGMSYMSVQTVTRHLERLEARFDHLLQELLDSSLRGPHKS